MAIGATAVWEIRTTATSGNVNGGFFITGASGTDYSQQDAAQYNLTGVTTAAADAILLTASAATDMVGNGCKIVSGTNFTVGWYEIISVVAGVSITLDRTCTSAAGSSGVVNIGGALSLGSSDDAVFEASTVAGHKTYIKAGTYTLAGPVSLSAAATSTVHCTYEGYNSARGDRPTGSTRPLINIGSSTITSGAYTHWKNVQFTGTGAILVTAGANNTFTTCKFENTSTTANRDGSLGAGNVLYRDCEFVSYRGYGLRSNQSMDVIGCYFHDCVEGYRNTGTGAAGDVMGCLFVGCTSYGINFTAANNAKQIFFANTFYGYESKVGTGVNLAAGCTAFRAFGNIFYGLAQGIIHNTSGQTAGISNHNNFYNNTTNRTDWETGNNDIALDPQFTDATEVSGSTATTSGGNLVDSGKDFTALGVVAGRDYLYLVSGTGVTTGIYGISSVGTTTITPDIAPGNDATTDKTYKITRGRDFSVGANMKNGGFPYAFPGGYTTSYMDIGAVQRDGGYSTDPGEANVKTGTAYIISDSNKTGTYTGSDRWTDPGEANVRSGTAYKADSLTNNKTGTLDLPSEDDVRAGTTYDNTTATGNMTLPAEADVALGEQYGTNGTEFTGTLVGGGGGGGSYPFVG